MMHKTIKSLLALIAALAIPHLEGATYHVWCDSPNPLPPYGSWATAATEIQQAIDLAQETGDVVLVTNGVYTTGGMQTPGYALTNRICATKAIEIRSVSADPADTLIVGAPDATTQSHGAAAVRCAYLAGGATLRGFTLTGGFTLSDIAQVQNSRGGGVASYGGKVIDCIITANQSAGGGGGVFCVAKGVVDQCQITANTTLKDGGGVYFGDVGTQILNSLVSDNIAETGSGGIHGWISGSVSNCVVRGNRGNHSASGVGGIFAYHGITVSHCTVTNNYAHARGGGMHIRGCTVLNSLVADNEARNQAGGISTEAVGVLPNQILGCTIVDNRCLAAAQSGGLYFYIGAAPTVADVVRNSIVWQNTTYNTMTNHPPAPSITYTTTLPAPDGMGNDNAEPRFLNTARGDYRLRMGSPCIDSGLTEPWMASGSDLAGLPRLRGQEVDRGAYEYLVHSTIMTVR